MFVLDPERFYPWPVNIVLPDSGEFVDFPFTARFAYIGDERLKEIFQSCADGAMDDADVVREVMVCWDDVVDMDKKPVRFSAEALDTMLSRFQGAAGDIVKGWIDSLGKGKTTTSEMPPSTGPA